MKKVVVIYGSKYGTTEKYAKWISEELNCDLFSYKNMKKDNLLNYDVIIYGGGVYAGGVKGISILKNNFEKIKAKDIVIFTCGISDPKDINNVNQINANINRIFDLQKNKITIFNLRGGIDYSKLTFLHKTMMKMLKKKVENIEEEKLTNENREFLDTYGKKVYFMDKTEIRDIVDFVKKKINL
jgi:menaquinone-dependent protoporphyrinogen IX oxidase